MFAGLKRVLMNSYCKLSKRGKMLPEKMFFFVFFGENILGHFFALLLTPFADNFKEFLSTLIRGGAIFVRIKGKKIETIQYFKKFPL
jgi:hypothetical protein